MSHEILINVTPQETRVAMLEQGVVQELHIERSSARGLVGNIYMGRVARVLPGKVLFEIEGMSEEIAREAFRLASAKLSVSTAFVKRQVRT